MLLADHLAEEAKWPSMRESHSPFHCFLLAAVNKGEVKGPIQSLLMKHRISLLDLASPWVLSAVQP